MLNFFTFDHREESIIPLVWASEKISVYTSHGLPCENLVWASSKIVMGSRGCTKYKQHQQHTCSRDTDRHVHVAN